MLTNNKTIQLSTTLDLMKSLQHISNGNTGPADIISQHNLRSDNLLRAISPNYQVISDPTTGLDTPPSNPKSSTMIKVSPDRPVPAAEDPASHANHNPAAIVHQNICETLEPCERHELICRNVSISLYRETIDDSSQTKIGNETGR